jgi:hypothetical protein
MTLINNNSTLPTMEEGKSLMSDIDSSINPNLPTYEISLPPHELEAQKAEKRKQEMELKEKIDVITKQIESLNNEKEQLLAQLAKVACSTTARNVRNQSMVITRTYDNEKTKMMDVIAEMKKGTQLLKYKRFGSAYHQFEITSDNQYLRWYSKNKKKFDKTSISLESIQHLQKGHLYKSEASAGQHAYAFSITYMDQHNNLEPKTLEVMAKDKTDFNIWTKGLEFILSTIQKLKKSGKAYNASQHFPSEHHAEIEYLNQKRFENKLSKREDPPKECVEHDLKNMKNKLETLTNNINLFDQNNNATSDKYDQIAIDAVNLIKMRNIELKNEIDLIEQHYNNSTKKLSILIHRIAENVRELNALDSKVYVIMNSYGNSPATMSAVSKFKGFLSKK